MKKLYQAVGTSKQNVHQRLNRQLVIQEESHQLKRIIDQIRDDHPRMGAKDLFKMLTLETMGRDRFYRWYREHGYTIHPKKNWRRTTDSSGVIRFPNLADSIELTGVNQLWVSDITYYDLKGKFFYLTFIMDQYSRKIKGYSVSKTLKSEHTTIPALQRAMRNLAEDQKPVFHSDGGGQYYSRSFLKLTESRFRNSMGKSAYENPFAERLNRTIKNNYLYPYNPTNYSSLQRYTLKAVKMYNEGKPHDGLSGLTPSYFESTIETKMNVKPLSKVVNVI